MTKGYGSAHGSWKKFGSWKSGFQLAPGVDDGRDDRFRDSGDREYRAGNGKFSGPGFLRGQAGDIDRSGCWYRRW
jgi:hypothetical protein